MGLRDMTGQLFGRLVVLEQAGRAAGGEARWKCLCDCGRVTEVDGSNLRRGNVKSCGCWLLDVHKTHGMSGTKVYNIWQHMHRRCSDPNVPGYKNYGARGIRVCERWQDFSAFYEDMGDPPPGLTLDRWPDNNGDYTPENCRWATGRQQVLNRRCARYVCADGVRMSLIEACETKQVGYAKAVKRLQRGQSIDDLFGEQTCK